MPPKKTSFSIDENETFIDHPTHLHFTIVGDPVSKKPSVMSTRHRKYYSPSMSAQKQFRQTFLSLCSKNGVSWTTKFHQNDAISVKIRMVFPRPSRHFDKDGFLKPLFHHRYNTCTPDADNVCKLVLDALKGLVFYDDAQVVKINLLKEYDHILGSKGKQVICIKKIE